MIIKKIILENIRSYDFEEIIFSPGSILLSGDIGSGKTSVLLAIEFGLFGLQPGQRGSSLLKNGKDDGKVILEFEIEDKNILIERKLKRGKSISQDYCAISINGKKEELSVSEVKQKVLEILNYPKEFSKKQNILYKFTVYTPQEEMKEIILEDSEMRVNTLRHVFGIDKYKTILENASILRLKLREERRLMEGITFNLEENKQEILDKENEFLKMKESTKILEEEFLLKSENRKKIELKIEEISKKIEKKNKIKQEIEKSKIMVLSKKHNLLENEKQIKEIEFEIKNFESLDFNENQFEKIEKKILEGKEEEENFNKKNLKISSEIESLKRKCQENKKLHDTMSDLKICPTCQQEVDAIYRANILNKAYNEISFSKRKIEEFKNKEKEISEKIKEAKSKISLNEKKLTDLKILKMKLEGIIQKKSKLRELKNGNEFLKKDLNLLESHTKLLNEDLFKFAKFGDIFNEKEKELKESLKQEKISEIKVAEIKKEIEMYFKSISELKGKVSKIEEINKKLKYVTELENWINKKFIPIISFLEKNVMASLKNEFSRLFSDWFQTLVSDQFIVRLSDDFTPIIEQQDYELDYAYLSGGERTAIALAYRLALNQVINSFMSRIKTKDLMILDEPTDGFSEQQLDKMRGVLEQLKVKQLIIVSHEQKIEGFVENVIKLKKEYGISRKE